MSPRDVALAKAIFDLEGLDGYDTLNFAEPYIRVLKAEIFKLHPGLEEKIREAWEVWAANYVVFKPDVAKEAAFTFLEAE